MSFEIREMEKDDWSKVAEIYREGILTANATFQTQVPTYEEWDNNHINSCRLVAVLEDDVIGWIALSKVSNKCVYLGVAEVSIYISKNYRGKGIGTKLLNNLIKVSEENGFWTLQSFVIDENIASISLHKKCEFRILGIRERIAKASNGLWHDVIVMERRSKKIGM